MRQGGGTSCPLGFDEVLICGVDGMNHPRRDVFVPGLVLAHRVDEGR